MRGTLAARMSKGGAIPGRLPMVLREPGPFRLLFTGQALSVLGDRLTPVAVAFAVLGLGSVTDLGLVMAAGGIPFALFSVAGGVVSDRLGRRRVMLASDVVRTVSQGTMAALLITGAAEVWMLAALSFVYGVAAALFMPALMGLIPQTVVGSDRLKDANALIALARSVASVAGPALAGVLIAAAGPGEAIAVDAVTFAVSAVCLALLRTAPVAATPGEAAEDGRFRARLRAGWHEVRARAWLRWGLLAMGSYHLFVLPAVFVLGPAMAERDLAGASSWATIVACWGVGAVLGNVVALRLPAHRPVLVAALALVLASMQGLVLGSGLGTAGIAALELVAGAGSALFFTLWDFSIQDQVPARAVSRVSSYDFTVSMGLYPLGMALAGPVATAVGLQTTLIATSVAGVAGAVAWLVQPSVRAVTRVPEEPGAPPQPAPAEHPLGAGAS
jgi:MFS family permease